MDLRPGAEGVLEGPFPHSGDSDRTGAPRLGHTGSRAADDRGFEATSSLRDPVLRARREPDQTTVERWHPGLRGRTLLGEHSGDGERRTTTDTATPGPSIPPGAVQPQQASRLGAIALVGALANFSGSLLTQNGDAVTSSFHRTDEALGFALALSRVGVLLSHSWPARWLTASGVVA